MKIRWSQNPLRTSFELDMADRELLQVKGCLHAAVDIINAARFRLRAGNHFSLPKARAALDSFNDIDADAAKRVGWMIQELENGFHHGDCTSQNLSCEKCAAEETIGVNTIAGASPHWLFLIDRVYRKSTPDNGEIWQDISIEEAIQQLEDYTPTDHSDRWKGEADQAAKWLRAYRDDHFGKPKAPPIQRGAKR